MEYTLDLRIVPGHTPLIVSHQNLDQMGISYQTLHKTTERPNDGYSERMEMRNYLSFLNFPRYNFLSISQLKTFHRNLSHPSVEKQMRIIESADIEDLPTPMRKDLITLVTN